MEPTQSTPFFIRFFQKRLNRRNYLIGTIVPYTIFMSLAYTNNAKTSLPFPLLVGFLLLAIIFVYYLSLGIRRLHDLNRNGLWLLANFIPFVNLIIMIYLYFWPGTNGDNTYGPKPEPKVSIKEILTL